jgi:hypothetical protein
MFDNLHGHVLGLFSNSSLCVGSHVTTSHVKREGEAKQHQVAPRHSHRVRDAARDDPHVSDPHAAEPADGKPDELGSAEGLGIQRGQRSVWLFQACTTEIKLALPPQVPIVLFSRCYPHCV